MTATKYYNSISRKTKFSLGKNDPFQCHFLFWVCMIMMLMAATVISAEEETSASVSLSKETFEELTAGKTVFIKWFAPWCGHCQELAPTWTKLAERFAAKKAKNNNNNDQGLIAEVDCSVHEAWCNEKGILGLPTLMFGDPSQNGIFLEEYRGDKTFEDLWDFAQSTLHKPMCSPGNIEVCDAETQTKLYALWNMSRSELQETVQTLETAMQKAKDTFQTNYATLQADYDAKSTEFELIKANVKRQIQFYKKLVKFQKERQTTSAGVN